MVIVIHQASNTGNALLYNEGKVQQRVAQYFHTGNTNSLNPFMYDKSYRLKILNNIERKNERAKNKCLHISINPTRDDLQKMNGLEIRNEINNMMEYMGYGEQPYFVYRHKDLDRVHFHVVSTRIHRRSGMKIKDNHERKKMQQFLKMLEEKYQLTQKEISQQQSFRFSPRSRNIKQNIENLFVHLNGIEELNTKEKYIQALKVFNVEIKKSGRGHVVLVTDGNGKAIRYPIRLSKFKEKPKFHQIISKSIQKQKKMSEGSNLVKNGEIGLSQSLIRDLVKLIPKERTYEPTTKPRLTRKKKGKGMRF